MTDTFNSIEEFGTLKFLHWKVLQFAFEALFNKRSPADALRNDIENNGYLVFDQLTQETFIRQ